jgi:sugar phosphate isomerase/epimerase
MSDDTDFLATCWTSAGMVVPGRTAAVSPVPIEERIAAASEAGYTGFGLATPDLEVVRDTIGYPGLSALFLASNLPHIELEYLEDWWTTGERRYESDRVRTVLLDAAAEVGAAHIKVGLGARQADDDELRLAREFEQLAADAASAGTRIALEPPALSIMPTLRPAVELVREVAHPAGGLLLDVWHVVRSGMRFDELLAIVPPEYVFAAELSDGAQDVVGNLFDDTFDRRLLPGRGEFDVAGFVSVVRQLGFDGPWGLEIMSTAQRALPVRQALENAIRAAREVFADPRAAAAPFNRVR